MSWPTTLLQDTNHVSSPSFICPGQPRYYNTNHISNPSFICPGQPRYYKIRTTFLSPVLYVLANHVTTRYKPRFYPQFYMSWPTTSLQDTNHVSSPNFICPGQPRYYKIQTTLLVPVLYVLDNHVTTRYEPRF
jgi:hypothetical protein